MKNAILITLFSLVINNDYCYSQTIGPEKLYYSIIGDNTANLYNGAQHYGYPTNIEGSAYLIPEFMKASVLYNGTWYKGVDFKLDLTNRSVVVRHPNGVLFNLFNARLGELNFGETIFRNGAVYGLQSSELLEVAYDGVVKVLISKVKVYDEKIVAGALEKKFNYVERYFLYRDGLISSINSQKDLLNFFKKEKNTVQNAIKSKGLKFKREKLTTIITAAKSVADN